MSLFKFDYSKLTSNSPSSITNNTNAKLAGVNLNEGGSVSSFGIDNIINTESDEHYDYMAECYSFLMEYNRSFFEANKTLYKNIMESCDSPEIIHEGFGDFFSKVREVIKKFLAWIKKIFAKFVAKLNSLFKSESYLKKNKNEFSKFTSEDEFSFEGYNYTNLSVADNVPVIQTIKMLDLSSASSLSGFFTQSNVDGTDIFDYTKMKKAHDDWDDKKEDFFDEFRGKVLNVSNEIPQSDFEEECFMIFRDGAKEKHTMTITSSDVSEAYRNFENYNKLKEAIEKTKRDIDREYEALEKYFEKSYKFSKDSFKFKDYTGRSSSNNTETISGLGITAGTDYQYDTMKHTTDNSGTVTAGNSVSTSEAKTLIESFLRARAAQVNMMSNIHGIAFTAKLTAAKDAFNQNKEILYRALTKIKGHKVSSTK